MYNNVPIIYIVYHYTILTIHAILGTLIIIPLILITILNTRYTNNNTRYWIH